MSNFRVITLDPRDGEVKEADWLDGYFGTHLYGVRFPDGTVIPDTYVLNPQLFPGDFAVDAFEWNKMLELNSPQLDQLGPNMIEMNGPEPGQPQNPFGPVFADEPIPQKVEAAGLLTRAALIVSGDRAAQHGPKERNHQNIADHWNAYLGARLTSPLTSLDVALMMVELKIARTKSGSGQTNQDNYVDMAGYAGIAGEIGLNGGEG